jgi:hypothetical protein
MAIFLRDCPISLRRIVSDSLMKPRKSWQEKLADSKDLPKIIRTDGQTMVVAAPIEVKELMDCIPAGKLATIKELRAALALKHGTDLACPLTTGIFAWIAAHASEEAAAASRKPASPYWRTLKAGGELNPKYPGGIDALRALLSREGHTIIQRGKRFFVKDYSQALYSFARLSR